MNKEAMTLVFMKEAGIDESKFKDYHWSWWQNPISKTSLRLTERGFNFLTDVLKLECHAMQLTNSDIGKNLKVYQLLDRHISTPFYIVRKNRIIFFGSQEKVMLELMGGDLVRYLSNFER